MRKKGTDIICDHCNKSFYRSPANCRTEKMYCSRDCMAAAYIGRISTKRKRAKVNCSFCKTEIEKPQWHINQTNKIFCNRNCFTNWKSKNWTSENNPCWRGGKFYYYGFQWKDITISIRNRDKFSCRSCGVNEKRLRRKLDIHHIVPFRLMKDKSEANSESNLISLCPVCHTKAEHKCKKGEVKNIKDLLLLIK